MNLDLPTQPIPEPIAAACAWLSAAERHDGGTLEDRITAGDLLDVLTESEPPYPPVDRSRPTVPLAKAAPHVIAALERYLETELATAERLRVAAALGELRQAVR